MLFQRTLVVFMAFTIWHSSEVGILSFVSSTIFIMLLALPAHWNQVFLSLSDSHFVIHHGAIPQSGVWNGIHHAQVCVVSLLRVKQKGLNGFVGAFSNKIKYVGYVYATFLPSAQAMPIHTTQPHYVHQEQRQYVCTLASRVWWREEYAYVYVHTCVMSARVFMHILRTVVMQIDPAAEGQVWFPLRALQGPQQLYIII